MINPELLALLVCPETHQDIALASPTEIGQINEAIGRGQVTNAAGEAVGEPVQGALIRTDRTIAYPIRYGIPVMLGPEGLVLSPVNLNSYV